MRQRHAVKEHEPGRRKSGAIVLLAAVSCCMAVIGLLPILIRYAGNLYLVGDYMTQIIPFVKESRRMILSGTPGWSHTSFLGANFVGTYAYYTVGSPFFWPLVFLPEHRIGVGLTVMFVLKHMTAAVTAYLFLRSRIRTEGFAFAGALVYAFSAYSLDSTFYYIFLDAVAFFPLVLLFADRASEGKGAAPLALAALLNAAANYYLFVGTSVFFLIYLFFRLRQTGNTPIKTALRCVAAYALGAVAAAGLLLPALFTLLETGKATDSFSKIWIGAVSAIPQALRILKAFVLPGEGVLRSASGFTFFTFYSNAAFLPFFGALFTVTALREKEKTRDVRLLRFLVLLSLIPFGNGLFSLFSTMNYTRWWYALVLVGVLVSLSELEKFRDDPPALRDKLTASARTIAKIALAVTLPLGIAKAVYVFFLRGFLESRLPEAAIRSMQTCGFSEPFSARDAEYLFVLLALTAASYVPLYVSLKKDGSANRACSFPWSR